MIKNTLDAHCHIDMYKSPLKVAREIEESGVATIAVTNLPSHYEMARSRLVAFKRIRLALGLHPLMAGQHSGERQLFSRLAQDTAYLGEVGLDFSSEGLPTKCLQIESFRFVLSCIGDQHRFISIHSRGAESLVLELLSEYEIPQVVFHWYSGPISVCKSIIAAGHYFSINPAMVRSAKGRQLIQSMPASRVLTETDGPYLQVGQRPVNYADLVPLLTSLSDLFGVSPQDLQHQVTANFRNLMSPT